MTRFKHEGNSDPASRRALFVSLGLIAALLASYWVLAEWHSVPSLISATLMSVH